jgi:hypothetical protein
MAPDIRPSRWARVYAASTWTLIGYFSLMAVVHLVLSVLFLVGVWDTGVGYVLDYETPAWVITILDGSGAFLLWTGYRRGIGDPRLGLAFTVIASVIMAARALWFVVIPVLILVTVAGSTHRVIAARRTDRSDA